MADVTKKPENAVEKLSPEDEARRAFLKRTGQFAAITPPTITFLLGTSLTSRAIAASGGNRPGWGWGDKNHNHTGPRRGR